MELEFVARITHGKMFRTRRGKYGCYEYRNGKKVKFVEKRSTGRYARKTNTRKFTNRRRY